MPSVARMKLTNLCLTNLGFKFCPICLGSLFARWLIGCNVALRPMQMCCWSRYTQEFAACLSLRLVPSTNCEIRSCTKHTFQSTSRFHPYWEHLQEAFELIIQYLAIFCCGIIINPKKHIFGILLFGMLQISSVFMPVLSIPFLFGLLSQSCVRS